MSRLHCFCYGAIHVSLQTIYTSYRTCPPSEPRKSEIPNNDSDLVEFLATYMIQVTDTIALHESEIQLEFIRASGPGGQNVNKVSSAVQLRFDAAGSLAIDVAVYERLKKIAGRRMTKAGILIIKANRFRSQEQNRQDAVNRLVLLIQRATEKPKRRRPTRPPVVSGLRRLAAKRHHGEIKRRRKTIRHSEEEA